MNLGQTVILPPCFCVRVCVCVVFPKPLRKAANFLDPPVREVGLSDWERNSHPPRQVHSDLSSCFRIKHIDLQRSIQSEHIEFEKKVRAEHSASSVLSLKGKWNGRGKEGSQRESHREQLQEWLCHFYKFLNLPLPRLPYLENGDGICRALICGESLKEMVSIKY